MKIYFDGCSFTYGAELTNHEEERYSRLVCDFLGAKENNKSVLGGSNDRIVRKLLVENNIEEYDLAIIQMTYPVRTEYWDGKWIKVNPKYNFARWVLDPLHKRVQYEMARIKKERNPFNNKFTDHDDHWMYHYKYIHTEHYSQVKENIQFQTIRNHCKAHNIPLLLLTINSFSTLDFDYVVKLNNTTRAEMGHPNKIGHQEIAKDIIKMI